MQFDGLKRREFITLLSGATVWPFAAPAQNSAATVVGWLSSRTAAGDAQFLPAFREALGAQGFTEGRNLTIEYRNADAQIDRLPMLAADLVGRRPAGSFVHADCCTSGPDCPPSGAHSKGMPTAGGNRRVCRPPSPRIVHPAERQAQPF
jgi:hypothetical protein